MIKIISAYKLSTNCASSVPSSASYKDRSPHTTDKQKSIKLDKGNEIQVEDYTPSSELNLPSVPESHIEMDDSSDSIFPGLQLQSVQPESTYRPIISHVPLSELPHTGKINPISPTVLTNLILDEKTRSRCLIFFINATIS